MRCSQQTLAPAPTVPLCWFLVSLLVWIGSRAPGKLGGLDIVGVLRKGPQGPTVLQDPTSCPASDRAPVFILPHCLPLLLPPCWPVSSCRQLCAPDVAACFAVINEGCFLSEKKHHRRDESRHWGFPGQDLRGEPWRLWRDHTGNFERVLLP